MQHLDETTLIRYALDELDPVERDRVEDFLKDHTISKAHKESIEEVIVDYALASSPAHQPRPELKDKILSEVNVKNIENSTKIVSLPFPSPQLEKIIPSRKITSLLPWALAACLMLASSLLYYRNGILENRILMLSELQANLNHSLSEFDNRESTLKTVIQGLESTISSAQEQLANFKNENGTLNQEISRLTALQQKNNLTIRYLQSQLNQSYSGFVVWDEEKKNGILKIEKLPPSERGKDYQLWVVDPKYKNPVDAGVFDVNEEGSVEFKISPKQQVEKVQAFAVSLEKDGGVPVAEGPMMLVGNF
ncbi:MAG: anti-sigma factor [Bacteroidota bacterium]